MRVLIDGEEANLGPMSDLPEFHGNPNDYDFNPEFVFNLKAENAALREGMKGDYDLDRWLDWVDEVKTIQAQLTAERELSGALREALSIASDYLPQHWDMDSVPLNKIEQALAQYPKHKDGE